MSATLAFPPPQAPEPHTRIDPPPARRPVSPRLRRGLRRDLRASCADGAAFGAMVGLGETYLPAFVLALGLGELTAGLVGSLPLIAGGLLQLVSPAAIRRLGSYKRWVVVCAALQALFFAPLVWAAGHGRFTATGVLLVASVYWACGLAAGPAWNTWIGTVVPRPVRARFFAQRTRASQVGVAAGFVIGGCALQVAAAQDRVLWAFAGLFALAGLARALSAICLFWQSERQPVPALPERLGWREFSELLSHHPGVRLLVYLVAVQAAVQMAGPFFTPFMFQQLHLGYVSFVSLIAVAFVTKIVALPLWGRVAHRYGANRLLWIGGIGIAPLSACWLVSQHFAWLFFVQFFGGVVWAAYELAFFLLFFESIEEKERTNLLTLYNLANTIAWVTGALVGGTLLALSGTTFQGYLWVFALSSLARCAALVLLTRVPRLAVAADEMALRPVAVRPNAASLDAPVLPSLPDQTTTA